MEIQQIEDIASIVEGAQTAANTAADVVAVVGHWVQLGSNGLCATLVVLWLLIAAGRYVLPLPVLCFVSIPSLLVGIVGTGLVAASGACGVICSSVLRDASSDDVYDELVNGNRGTVAAELESLLALATAQGQSQCSGVVGSLATLIAPGCLKGPASTLRTELCTAVPEGLTNMGLPFAAGACVPFVVDVVFVVVRAFQGVGVAYAPLGSSQAAARQ